LFVPPFPGFCKEKTSSFEEGNYIQFPSSFRINSVGLGTFAVPKNRQVAGLHRA